MKVKFMFHAMKTKSVLTIIIFSFILTLKNTIIEMKKNMKRKVDKLSKRRCFSEFIIFN